jgi:hypothetical protein
MRYTIHFVINRLQGKNIKVAFEGTKVDAKRYAGSYARKHQLIGVPCYIWEDAR